MGKLQANHYCGVIELVSPSNNPCTPREGDANSNNIIPLRSEKKSFLFFPSLRLVTEKRANAGQWSND